MKRIKKGRTTRALLTGVFLLSIVGSCRDSINEKVISNRDHAEIMKLQLSNQARVGLEILDALEKNEFEDAKRLAIASLYSLEKKAAMIDGQIGESESVASDPWINRGIEVVREHQTEKENGQQEDEDKEKRTVRLIEP